MRLTLALLACVLTASAAIAAPQPTVTKTTTPARPKVSYAYSIVSPRQFKVSVKAFTQATQITSVPASIACNGVAITGGFSGQSSDNLSPQGLVRTVDRTVSSLADWRDGGVLSIVGDTARIVRISEWRGAPTSEGVALQAKPLLVADGKVDEPLGDRSRWNRVAVGTMRDGRVVLIGAFTPHNNTVTLREFAQDAISVLGPNLVMLLNMDGGPSAFLYSKDVRLMPSQGAVTTYVCVEGE